MPSTGVSFSGFVAAILAFFVAMLFLPTLAAFVGVLSISLCEWVLPDTVSVLAQKLGLSLYTLGAVTGFFAYMFRPRVTTEVNVQKPETAPTRF